MSYTTHVVAIRLKGRELFLSIFDNETLKTVGKQIPYGESEC